MKRLLFILGCWFTVHAALAQDQPLAITDDMLKNPEVAADFITGEAKIELKDGKLTMPPHSSAILRAKEG